MQFNDIELKRIYECLSKINSDNDYKELILRYYNNEEYDNISIYDIYVIEELQRLGHKCIIEKLLSLNPNIKNTLQQADEFLSTFKSDDNFRYFKTEQFKDNQSSLSDFELYLFEHFLNIQKEKDEKNDKQKDNPEVFVYSDDDYEDMNTLDYSNDFAIRRTVRNLLFGKFIHLLLQQSSMQEIAKRQKKKGQIHNMDRERVIDYVLKEFTPQIEDKFNNEVEKTWRLFKIKKMFTPDDPMISKYEEYNTNISESEILAKNNEKYRKR